MATRPTTGVHGVNLTIDGVIDSFDPLSIDQILDGLFGLKFSDFYATAKTRAYERYYSACYSYKNKIFLYTEGRTKNNDNTVHLEIKGSAFDYGVVSEDRIKGFCLTHNVSACDFDIYNDDAGEILKFDKLKRQVDRHYFTSKHKVVVWPGSTEGAPRTIYFGTKPQRLCIYEKGLKSAQDRTFDYPLSYLRLEVQLSKEIANAAFKRWCSGEDPGALAAALIAGMVEFKSLKDTDRNNTRRKVCPDWQRYLGATEKLRLTVPRSEPDKDRQLDAFKASVRNRLIEHDYKDIMWAFSTTLSEHLGNDKIPAYFSQMLSKLTSLEAVAA
ncbi:replication initiation factor domain-containing protein [Geomonas edaphica]|uniref:replication initiation factor domain-containing protein n=1 Tax=Geomonas edaphica TaxID=2570226 RepID=UPI0010A8617C|nr:replication initiation factor domain-containing protein [Geomonas edaphica]